MHEKGQFYEKFIAAYPVSMDGNLFADFMGGVSDYVCGFATSKRGDNLASLRSRSGNAGYIGGWV